MDLLLAFTSLTVFALMLTIGVNQSFEQLTSLWHQREVLLRSFLAVIVLVPAVVVGLSDAQQVIPTLVAYMLLGSAAAIPYSVWIKRQMT